MQTIKALYTATATATGGRDGRAVSSDGVLDVKLSTPARTGRPGRRGHQPGTTVRCRLLRLLHRSPEVRCRPAQADPSRRRLDNRQGRHRPDSRRLRPGGRTAHQPAGPGARSRRSAGSRRPPGLPLLQRYPRQYRRTPERVGLKLPTLRAAAADSGNEKPGECRAFLVARKDQALTRDLYSPVRVSISIESPISQNAETCSSAPLFRRAVFITLPEVSPRTAGSV